MLNQISNSNTNNSSINSVNSNMPNCISNSNTNNSNTDTSNTNNNSSDSSNINIDILLARSNYERITNKNNGSGQSIEDGQYFL